MGKICIILDVTHKFKGRILSKMKFSVILDNQDNHFVKPCLKYEYEYCVWGIFTNIFKYSVHSN